MGVCLHCFVTYFAFKNNLFTIFLNHFFVQLLGKYTIKREIRELKTFECLLDKSSGSYLDKSFGIIRTTVSVCTVLYFIHSWFISFGFRLKLYVWVSCVILPRFQVICRYWLNCFKAGVTATSVNNYFERTRCLKIEYRL